MLLLGIKAANEPKTHIHMLILHVIFGEVAPRDAMVRTFSHQLMNCDNTSVTGYIGYKITYTLMTLNICRALTFKC